MRMVMSLLLAGIVLAGLSGCRRSAEEEGPPPGAVVEPSQMQMQAPAPGQQGGQQGQEGMQAPVRRPPR